MKKKRKRKKRKRKRKKKKRKNKKLPNRDSHKWSQCNFALKKKKKCVAGTFFPAVIAAGTELLLMLDFSGHLQARGSTNHV